MKLIEKNRKIFLYGCLSVSTLVSFAFIGNILYDTVSPILKASDRWDDLGNVLEKPMVERPGILGQEALVQKFKSQDIRVEAIDNQTLQVTLLGHQNNKVCHNYMFGFSNEERNIELFSLDGKVLTTPQADQLVQSTCDKDVGLLVKKKPHVVSNV